MGDPSGRVCGLSRDLGRAREVVKNSGCWFQSRFQDRFNYRFQYLFQDRFQYSFQDWFRIPIPDTGFDT